MTMEDKVQKLLQPRYELIADYPMSAANVGEIFYHVNGDDFESERDGWSGKIMDRYPHLFRKLSWWEKREESEMPEFVKVIYTRPSYQLEVGSIRQVKFEKLKAPHEWVVDAFPVYLRIEDTEPATESDYLTFINNPK